MPLAEECLNAIAEQRDPREIRGHAGTISDIAECVMEIKQTKNTPVKRGIPDDFGYHNLRVIHQCVLLFVDAQPDICQAEEELVMYQGAPLYVFAIQITADQVSGQPVGDGNQITS